MHVHKVLYAVRSVLSENASVKKWPAGLELGEMLREALLTCAFLSSVS